MASIELPKSRSELECLFFLGSVPDVMDFKDLTFRVDMLTGLLPNMARLGHRKEFSALGDTKVQGVNIIARVLMGYFNLEAVHMSPRILRRARRAVLIDYGKKPNFIWRPVRDYVVWLANHQKYLGVFTYWSKPLAYFSLTQIDAVKTRAEVAAEDIT